MSTQPTKKAFGYGAETAKKPVSTMEITVKASPDASPSELNTSALIAAIAAAADLPNIKTVLVKFDRSTSLKKAK